MVMVSDRTYWVDMLYKIAGLVLSNMSKGELQKNMILELSPQWDGCDERGYMGNVWSVDGRDFTLVETAE